MRLKWTPSTVLNARLYDPVLGRFISADSLVPDATNWDDYNRYMYVRGNPMRYTDPSGHSPESKKKSSSNSSNNDILALDDVIVTAPAYHPSDNDRGCDSCAERRTRKAELRRQKNEMSYAQNAYDVNEGIWNIPSYINGVGSFFRGLYRYSLHEFRLLGGAGSGEAIQASTIEHMLLGEALGLSLLTNKKGIKLSVRGLLANGEKIAARQMTSLSIGVILGGGGMGPSLGMVSGMGDVYHGIKSLASELKLYVTTVDHTKPILPQISDTKLRNYAKHRLSNIVNVFLSGEN